MINSIDIAVEDAMKVGKAVLKFISRDDVGETGGHQCGYYLPKNSWQLFTDIPPEKGKTLTKDVRITWGNGQQTASSLKWYGTGTRSEYRLTKFGRGFTYLDQENVGSLLILIPHDYSNFSVYVFDKEEDIEDIQAFLGTEVVGKFAIFEKRCAPC